MLELNGSIKIERINVSGSDLEVLYNMYLPLIGEASLTTYLLLNNLFEDEVSVKKILDMLSYSNLQTLIRNINKLEGIGLLKEYNKEGKPTLLKVIRPLSGKSFLNNNILKPFLITSIGEVEYEKLREEYFDFKKVKGYVDVTKSFDEVFSKTKERHIFIDENGDEESNIEIRNASFDYTYFKMLLDNILPMEVLDDINLKKEIIKVSYNYNLNEHEMCDALKKSMTNDKDIDFSKIGLYAGYIYQNKVPDGVINFKDNEVVEYDHEFTSGDLELLRVAKAQSIAQTLAQVSGGKGSLVEVRDFTRLIETTGLSIGAVNIMIMHLVNQKEGDNLSYNYIEKVARNWMKAGVKTAEDALLFIKKKEDNKKSRTVTEPEWMKEEEKKEKEEKENTSDIKEAEELMKKIFGDE